MKRSKFLSVLLAALIVISSFSCLSVVSFAATIASGGEYDEEGNLLDVHWELTDTGLLTIYCDVTGNPWAQYASRVRNVVIKPDVTTISNSAFAGYNIYSVSFGGTLNKIEAGAFSDCDNLTQLTVPGTTAIEDYAFYDCDNLTSVTVCGGMAQGKVGKNIFKSCDKLKTVEILNGAIEIGEGMFEDCVALKTLALPDSICKIGRLAFENCKSLENITIPDSVTEVGGYAFYGCEAAEAAYIGHNVESIGEYVFGKCTSLAEVEIKCAMPAISEGMFYGCSSLTGLAELPEGIKTIGKNAFAGCTAFAEIDFPSSLVEIGESAFDSSALVTVTIPGNVQVIGSGAFTNCGALTAINVDAKNREYASVDGVLYDIALDTLICCPAGKNGSYIVYEGTQTISEDAFIGCTKLTDITVPGSVSAIANNAFNGCDENIIIKTDCGSVAAVYAAKRGIATELNHSGGLEWVVTVEPDCETEGEREQRCVGCGFVYVSEKLDALGHSYDNGTVTTKEKCETDGVLTYKCTRNECGYYYTEVIPATGHSLDSGTVTVAATCEEDGNRLYKCTNTGCNYRENEAIPATGHAMDKGTVVLEAACEADGKKVYKCTNSGCVHEESEVIPAIGHKLDNGTVTKAATCEENGVLTYTCKNSGCIYIETDVIPATGHSYKSAVIKTATCMEDGKVKYTCEYCGDSYTESLAGEHKLYSEPQRTEPTCEEDGKEGSFCSICHQYVGEVTTIPATGHSYENGKCTECGKSDGSVKPATPELVKVGNTIRGPVIYWNEVDKADYYKIYALVDGKWTYVATVNAEDKNNYVDTKAVSGKAYTYSVSAVNGTIEGAYDKDGLTILFLDDPALKSIANTRTGVKVTWGKIEGATSYNVYRRTAASTWKRIKTVSTTSYTDTTAKSGTAYIYTVRARNGSTLSSYVANGINILYLATPDVKSATAATNGVTVKWAQVSGAKIYRVYRKTGNGSWELLAKVSGSASSYKDKTAKSGKTYTYTVKAQNGSVTSSYESAGAKLKFLATPKLTSAKASTKGVTVKFGAVTGATGYRVYRKTANGSWQLLTTTKSTSYTDKTAKKGVTYIYTVRAVSGSYKSSYNSKGISCKAK